MKNAAKVAAATAKHAAALKAFSKTTGLVAAARTCTQVHKAGLKVAAAVAKVHKAQAALEWARLGR